MQVNMNKVVIKILQGSVATQTELGGLHTSSSCQKYWNWSGRDRVIASKLKLTFFLAHCVEFRWRRRVGVFKLVLIFRSLTWMVDRRSRRGCRGGRYSSSF